MSAEVSPQGWIVAACVLALAEARVFDHLLTIVLPHLQETSLVRAAGHLRPPHARGCKWHAPTAVCGPLIV